MTRYRFNQIKTTANILKRIGREDIDPTKVVIRCPAVDQETGEYLADIEIDFGDLSLSQSDEVKLSSLMEQKGMTLKEKKT